VRIGVFARQAGTTARTVRYYEEIGLLEPSGERPSGRHREYTEADVERLREILRFKDLLGVSLDELRELMAAQDARRAIRAEFRRTEDPRRRRRLLEEALGHLDRQLELVRRRAAELAELEGSLAERRELVVSRLEDESAGRPAKLRA
jgi:DNA-binding transcriptional MerR regulator